MTLTVMVSFRGFTPTTALRDEALRAARALEGLSTGPASCFVVVERAMPWRHHGDRYVVRVRVIGPGQELVSSRTGGADPCRGDALEAVHAAFEAVRRGLVERFPRRRRAPAALALAG